MTLTLVPDDLAAKGYRFRATGADPEECAGCPFRKLCLQGLTAGRVYEVVAVREVAHPCALHDSGKARVVEVAETDFASSVETRLLRGTAATWTPMACGRPQCPNYGLCHPVGPTSGGKHAITATEGTLECPAGFELTKVRLKPM